RQLQAGEDGARAVRRAVDIEPLRVRYAERRAVRIHRTSAGKTGHRVRRARLGLGEHRIDQVLIREVAEHALWIAVPRLRREELGAAGARVRVVRDPPVALPEKLLGASRALD